MQKHFYETQWITHLQARTAQRKAIWDNIETNKAIGVDSNWLLAAYARDIWYD